MKSRSVFSGMLLLLTFYINAQSSHYYYYKGQKIYLTIDKSLLNVSSTDTIAENFLSGLGLEKVSTLDDHSTQTLRKFSKLRFTATPTDIQFYQAVNSLKQNNVVQSVSYFYERQGAESIGTSNVFYVKLKDTANLHLLQRVATERDVTIIQHIPNMPLWYRLSLRKTSVGSSVELSSKFYETGLFESIDPAFMFDFRPASAAATPCTNDENFDDLWGLYNAANPNIDINACEAWQISEGAGVNVAILDHPFDKTHADLDANTHTLSYNAQFGTEPSEFAPFVMYHGSHVAGIVAAEKNNNFKVVGVAPQAKLICVSHSLSGTAPTYSEQLADGIEWAWQNGADIINCSWGDQGGSSTQMHGSILEDAIYDALVFGRNNKGSLVVFSSGNKTVIDYPAYTHEKIITVGAINITGHRAIFEGGLQFSGAGPSLDLVAPGFDIWSTVPNNGIDKYSGTSMAAPHVSGTIALMLSVNPCLTGDQIRTILETTAQKVGTYQYATTSNRPNGTWHNVMGYGLVDAHACVLAAQQATTPVLDLFIRDHYGDNGAEPSNAINVTDSPDIWSRRQADGITNQTHQTPKFQSAPNRVYVRIKNRSCYTSNVGEEANLYYSRPANHIINPPTTLSRAYILPVTNTEQVLIGTQPIPVLEPGEEAILQFPWMVPDPLSTSMTCTEPWFESLLYAKIVSTTDLLAVAEVANSITNVRNNNNIAAKSTLVILEDPGEITLDDADANLVIANLESQAKTYKLEMYVEPTESGKPIYEEAEVGMTMDDDLYEAWEGGGKLKENVNETVIDQKKIVAGNNVLLDSISFAANRGGVLKLSFNFLTEELTEKDRYRYHILQREVATDTVVGFVTLDIRKPARTPFLADAGGDRLVDYREAIVLSATDIGEPATYRWYDEAENFLFEGKDLSLTPEREAVYRLEVTALSDKFKDYCNVTVGIRPARLETIAPNPVSGNVTINYNLNGSENASLMIIGYYGNNFMAVHPLALGTTSLTLNMTGHPAGFYTAALVCGGEIIDAKSVIKQ